MSKSTSLAVLISSLLLISAVELPVAKVTLHVTDEEGKNLSGVDAGVSFLNPVHKPGAWGSSGTFSRSGKTDNNGSFTVEERGGFEIHYGASGTNYYKSLGRFDFKTERGGRYEPWNPTFVITLMRIIHPIPMYAKRVETKFPLEAWPVGFDLVESDWVFPYGRGKASDFVLEATRQIEGSKHFRANLRLRFSTIGDGICAVPLEIQNFTSELRLPHNAPQDGYAVERIWDLGKLNTVPHEQRQRQSYFYRVRTVQENGRVASALYGKIHGDFELHVGTQAPTPGIAFTYYLNPTPNDRNIEFDPKRNLFTNLKDDEWVTAP